MNFKEEMHKKSGITLISLVVIVIILLILAGITITTIISDNGIIKNANDAKEQTEIAEEKEIVDRASLQAMGNNKRGNLVQDELQEELDKITDSGKTEVSDNGENFEVVFVDNNRYYNVDKDGNIIEEGKIIIDKSPGDITKDENGDNIEEGQPYEIWCIEDLVEWSQNYQNYQNSNIILGRTLNFKSNYSYSNGKMLGCNSIEELKGLLTNTEGTGFTPINIFNGTFDGQGYEIKNIYINNQNENVGFIASVEQNKELCIKNFGISGTIIGSKNVGGILGNAGITNNTNILDCYNKANIYNYNTYTGISLNGVGGIVGYITNGNVSIEKCYNEGNIYSASELNTYGYSGVGGILGKTHSAESNIIINNCYNTGKIEGKGCRTGGISGVGDLILNSYNSGEIINGSGITGFGREVINCFNMGKTVNGIYGTYYSNTITIKNVYTIAKTSAFPIVNWSNSACTYDISNAFYSENCSQVDNRGTKISEALMKADGLNDTDDEKALLTLLNNFVDEYNKNENVIKLNRWEIDNKSGYPIFE